MVAELQVYKLKPAARSPVLEMVQVTDTPFQGRGWEEKAGGWVAAPSAVAGPPRLLAGGRRGLSLPHVPFAVNGC